MASRAAIPALPLAIISLLLICVGQCTAATDVACANSSTTATCTAMLVRNFDALWQSNTTLNSSERWDAIVSTVDSWSTCAGAPSANLRPLHLLVVDAYQSISTLVAQTLYSKAGWVVTATYLSSSLVYKELQNMVLQNVTHVYDGVIFSNKYLSDVGRSGLVMDLTSFITKDPTVQWADMTLYFRDSSAYNGQIVGMPLVGMTFALHYRKDVLAAHNITEPPYTWDDLATLAERLNGTDIDGDGVGEYAVCHSLGVYCQPPHIFLDIATNLLQYTGPQQGFLFDPETLRPLIQNPAMAYALGVHRRLARVNIPPAKGWQVWEPGCGSGTNNFLQGKCIFTIQNSAVLKGTIQPQNKAIQGRIGSAMVPGSTHVLDRSTNQLVRCTTSLCPYAVTRKLLDGSSQLVNNAPWKGTAGYSGSVFAGAESQYRQAMFQYLSTAASSDITWASVLAKDGFAAPLRESQLSDTSLQPWLDAGYNADDVLGWLAVTRKTLGSSNAALPNGLPDQDSYQQLFEDAAFAVTYNDGWDRNITEVLQHLDANITALMSHQGGTQVLLPYYRAALGLTAKGGSTADGTSGQGSSDGLGTDGLVASVVAPVAFTAVLCGALYMVWQLQHARRRSLLGRIKPPRAGQDTTLMLTDVQDSTTLYELLPAHVMDQAMKIHHDVIAAMAVKNYGYLVLTEGDSFLIAFHQPMDAVLAACDIQEALLQAPWPTELVSEPRCRPVWVMPRMGVPSTEANDKAGGTPRTSRIRGLLNALINGRTAAGDMKTQLQRSSMSAHHPHHYPHGVSGLLRLRLRSILHLHGNGHGHGHGHHAAPAHAPVHASALPHSPGASVHGGFPWGGAPLPSIMQSGPLAIYNENSQVGEMQDRPSWRHSTGSGSPRHASTNNLPAAASGNLNNRSLFATITQGRAKRAGLSDVLGASPTWNQLSPANGTPFGSPANSTYISGQPNDWPPAPLYASQPAQPARHRTGHSSDLTSTMQSQHLIDACIDTGDHFLTGEHVIDARPGPVAHPPALEPIISQDDTNGDGHHTMAFDGSGEITMKVARQRSSLLLSTDRASGSNTWGGSNARHLQSAAASGMLESASSQSLAFGSLPACCVLDHLQRMAPVVDGPGAGRQMVFAGLRVRIALHSGIPDEADVVYNKAAGRMAYSGPALALLRKVLSATVWGGVVILTEATCKALPVEAMRARLVVAHEGEHVLGGKTSANGSARPGRQLRQQQQQQPGPEPEHGVEPQDLDQPPLSPQPRSPISRAVSRRNEPLNLYRVIPNALLHRTYLTAETIKSSSQLCHGFLRAPYASGAVVFMNAVGVQSLMSWNATTATEALSLWRSIAQQHLYAADGYLAESAEGLMLAVFSSPASAARWALTVMDACLHAPWPQLLLEHELGEEVAIVAPLNLMVPAAPPAGFTQPRHHSATSTFSTTTATTATPTLVGPSPAIGIQSAAGSMTGSTQGPPHAHHHLPAPGAGERVSSPQEGSAAAAAAAAAQRRALNKTTSSRSVSYTHGMVMRAASGHETGLLMPMPSMRSQLVRTLLFRGLRLKCGIDHGQLSSDLHHVSGRIMYRGRVMNRAARVAGVAKTGQVWMTAEGWAAAAPTVNRADAYPPTAKGGGLMGGMPGADGSLPLISPIELEPQKLKGISEEVQLVQLSMDNATTGHTLGPAAMANQYDGRSSAR